MDDDLDIVFKALADPTRRAILDRLRSGRQTTGDLADVFPEVTRFAVMKHLSVLEGAGLVATQKEGRRRWNHLNAVPLRRVYDRWVSRYADRWAGVLLALDERVTRGTEGDGAMAEMMSETRVCRILVESEIDASREKVFRGMVEGIGEWWVHPAGEKPPMRIEPKVGGRFFEDHGDDKGHMFGTVTVYEPSRKLRFVGDFTNREAALNVVTIDFEEVSADKTRVKIDHRSSGEVSDDFAASFEQGWTEIAGMLKAYCEK